jgi:hypothetical protein
MKKSHVLTYLLYGFAAAVAYCIPVTVFLIRKDYTDSWMLFAGCILFLFVLIMFLVHFNKKRNENAATGTMLVAGHIATATGILLSVLLCFILLMIFVPGFLGHPDAGQVLHREPANIVKDKTEGLAFMIFMTATVGNFSAGSFVTIIFPFTVKKDQTKEKVTRRQMEL